MRDDNYILMYVNIIMRMRMKMKLRQLYYYIFWVEPTHMEYNRRLVK